MPRAKFHECPRCHKTVRSWCAECFRSQDSFRYWVVPGRREYNKQKAKDESRLNPERSRLRAREWEAKNPERRRELARKSDRKRYKVRVVKNKQWFAERPDYLRDRHLRRTFGITVEDEKRMLAEQQGLCAICQNPILRGKLHVDHDHGTGFVRGLLCAQCNHGLGQFRDNPAFLISGSLYLIQAAEKQKGLLGQQKNPRRK